MVGGRPHLLCPQYHLGRAQRDLGNAQLERLPEEAAAKARRRSRWDGETAGGETRRYSAPMTSGQDRPVPSAYEAGLKPAAVPRELRLSRSRWRPWRRRSRAAGERSPGMCGRRAVPAVEARDREPEIDAEAEGRGGKWSWRSLRADPNSVPDGSGHGGPAVHVAPSLAFRGQTASDLKAARWNLAVWEDPHCPLYASLFRPDRAMIKAKVLDAADAGDDVLRHVARRPWAMFMGGPAAA